MTITLNGVKYASQAVADLDPDETMTCAGCNVVFADDYMERHACGEWLCHECMEEWRERDADIDEYGEGCRRYHAMVDRKLEEGGA